MLNKCARSTITEVIGRLHQKPLTRYQIRLLDGILNHDIVMVKADFRLRGRGISTLLLHYHLWEMCNEYAITNMVLNQYLCRYSRRELDIIAMHYGADVVDRGPRHITITNRYTGSSLETNSFSDNIANGMRGYKNRLSTISIDDPSGSINSGKPMDYIMSEAFFEHRRRPQEYYRTMANPMYSMNDAYTMGYNPHIVKKVSAPKLFMVHPEADDISRYYFKSFEDDMDLII